MQIRWDGGKLTLYPPPPRTIHPTHQIATILEESVIVLRRLPIHSNNIVMLAPVLSTPLLNFPKFTSLWYNRQKVEVVLQLAAFSMSPQLISL